MKYCTIPSVVLFFLLAGTRINNTAAAKRTKESKSSNSHSKSLRRVTDLPRCTDVDPVILTSAGSAIIPLELLRKYTGTSPTKPPYVVGFEDMDPGGRVDVVTDLPLPCLDSTTFSNSPYWCNTKGQQLIRAKTHGMCVQDSDSDPEYYYIKFVGMNFGVTTGVCTLLRVSHHAPGIWIEYQTPSMQNLFELIGVFL